MNVSFQRVMLYDLCSKYAAIPIRMFIQLNKHFCLKPIVSVSNSLSHGTGAEGLDDTVSSPGSTVVAQAVLDAVDDVHDGLGNCGIRADPAGLDGTFMQGLGNGIGCHGTSVSAQAVADASGDAIQKAVGYK